MKTSPTIILVLLASFAVAQEVRRQRTERPPVNINPSQTIPPINPSQTLRPTLPAAPAAPPAPVVQPLTVKVFISITRGPNELQGLPPMGNAGIPVDGLRVETDRGSVVLSGVVRSEWDKAEAGRRAAALAGPGKVVNRLVVRP
ncbi:MAG: BON domain-containing protein [Elusimicrobiota bacterium]|nr:BON domain-containing protein [Elusimicrobiota bacterium]